MQLSPQEAAQHLLNRRRARRSAEHFASVIEVPGRPLSDDEDAELFQPVETHLRAEHKVLLRALQETSETPEGRLMVFMPPGAGKSTYTSVVFPSWFLGGKPDRKLILVSYGHTLAKKMGRRTRSILRQARYRRIFDTVLSDESAAADQFALANGSEYMASGLLAGITGNRAHGIVIDDPVAGIGDARSETMQESTWEAYQNDLLTRLIPGGWLVLVMTRWDMADLAGRVLPHGWNGESGTFDCKDGKKWRVLCIQAKCETTTDPLGRKPGEYLAPEWFPATHWTQFEANAILWNSLYQQRPQPLGGAFFKEEHLLVRDESNSDIPVEKRPLKPVATPRFVDGVFAIIDCAAKDGSEHDGVGVTYWAVSLHGMTPYKLYVLDWDYTQLTSDLLITWLPQVFERANELALEVRARAGSLGAWIEDKAGGIVLLQQAKTSGWLAQKGQNPSTFLRPGYGARSIDSKLTAAGKLWRNVNASGPVARGEVKFTEHAFTKTVNFKGVTKNHQWDQVIGFRTGVKQMPNDDLDDTFCYGVAIGLGNDEGY